PRSPSRATATRTRRRSPGCSPWPRTAARPRRGAGTRAPSCAPAARRARCRSRRPSPPATAARPRTTAAADGGSRALAAAPREAAAPRAAAAAAPAPRPPERPGGASTRTPHRRGPATPRTPRRRLESPLRSARENAPGQSGRPGKAAAAGASCHENRAPGRSGGKSLEADPVAEALQALDEGGLHDGHGEGIEIGQPEILVGAVVPEHVVGGDEDLVRDGQSCPLW